MGILGINFSHDGSLSYVENGQHLFSIAEERINRTKGYLGFPFKALSYAVDCNIINPKKIDSVAVAINTFPVASAETLSFLLTEDRLYYDIINEERPVNYYNSDLEWKKIKTESQCRAYVVKRLTELLGRHHITAPLFFKDHHLCHASSAYYSSGHNNQKILAITMDGEGDGLSASVNICENGKITQISETDRFNSLGYLYSAVTKKCGFKITKHEGKITGLAAFGKPERAYNFFKNLILVEDGILKIIGLKDLSISKRILNKGLKYFGFNVLSAHDELIHSCFGLINTDLSAGIQNLLEDRIKEIVSYWSKQVGTKHIVLAGGVFANVKFNQRIGELDCVDSLYIYPDMGDGGLAYGAAMLKHTDDNQYNSKLSKLETVYQGPEFSDEKIHECLKKYTDLEVSLSKNIAKDSAALVADKKILGWFQGRMEYGPRALGNRSILATPVDGNINNWLNQRLKRTEFMPFAPSCLYESADELFEIPKENLKRAAEFMTITFKVRKGWLAKVPAIVHIDETARPQLVRENANPLFYSMIHEFKKLTGLPLVLNTSFNLHEQPIVCHPDEAVEALKSNMIDILVIGNYIVKNKYMT